MPSFPAPGLNGKEKDAAGGKEEGSEDPVQTLKRVRVSSQGSLCFLTAGQSSLGTGAKEAPNGSGIFHKLSSLSLSLFFFSHRKISGDLTFSD